MLQHCGIMHQPFTSRDLGSILAQVKSGLISFTAQVDVCLQGSLHSEEAQEVICQDTDALAQLNWYFAKLLHCCLYFFTFFNLLKLHVFKTNLLKLVRSNLLADRPSQKDCGIYQASYANELGSFSNCYTLTFISSFQKICYKLV